MVMALLPMLAPALAPIAGKLVDIVDRFIPDPIAAEKLKMELLRTLQASDLGQIEVNKIEAAHASMFVAGARPAIMWICAAVMATYYIPFAIVATFVWTATWWQTGVIPARPDIGMTDVLGLLGAMLGLGAMRSYEKIYGVDTKQVAPVSRDPATLADKIRGK